MGLIIATRRTFAAVVFLLAPNAFTAALSLLLLLLEKWFLNQNLFLEKLFSRIYLLLTRRGGVMIAVFHIVVHRRFEAISTRNRRNLSRIAAVSVDVHGTASVRLSARLQGARANFPLVLLANVFGV